MQNLAGKTVGDVLPDYLRDIPTVDARATVIKVAAEMARATKSADRGHQGRKVAWRDHRIPPAGRGAEILSAASPPMPSQARAQRQDNR